MATRACMLTPEILPKMKLLLSVVLFQCIAICKEATSAVHWKLFILLCVYKKQTFLYLSNKGDLMIIESLLAQASRLACIRFGVLTKSC